MTTVIVQNEAQEQRSRAGATAMRRPTKDQLYAHIAHTNTSTAELAALLADIRRRLNDAVVTAVAQNDAQQAAAIVHPAQLIDEALHRVQALHAPRDWMGYLPHPPVERPR